MIRVGTCGYARSQTETFRALPAVEVQQTFYRPPRPATAKAWRSRAPASFVFTAKAWQLITHEPTSPTYRKAGVSIPPDRADRFGAFRPTEEVFAAWERTREVCALLRCPVVVFQTPARFAPTPEHVRNVYAFFESVERDRRFAWEPRGDWAPYLVEKICGDLDLVHAVDPFAAEPVTVGTAYYRLHGRPPGDRRYRYTYTDDELGWLAADAGEFDEAYVMFNNVTMFDDALRLLAVLEAGP